MLLHYAPSSPFARKIRIVLRERGLKSRVNEMTVRPFDDDPALLLANPLGLVPTLVLDDGQVLADSAVIAAYLDTQGAGPSLLPVDERQRWRTLTFAALTDGVMEQALKAVLENRRPAHLQSPAVTARAFAKIERTLGALERYVAEDQPWNLAHIGIIVALEYLDFRHGVYLWRPLFPALARWHETVKSRPSVAETALSDAPPTADVPAAKAC